MGLWIKCWDYNRFIYKLVEIICYINNIFFNEIEKRKNEKLNYIFNV